MLLDACAAAIHFYIGKAWDQLGWPVTLVDLKNTRFGCNGLILHGPFTPAPQRARGRRGSRRRAWPRAVTSCVYVEASQQWVC